MYQILNLPYAYKALEPSLDEETMRIHHDKHHQVYCDKLNSTLEKYPDLANRSADDLLRNLEDLPAEIRLAVRNFGGGYVNHNFFWQILRPAQENNLPEGKLAQKINEQFGSFADLKKQFNEKAASLFGSGWAWLVLNKDKQLEIMTTSNQDSPLSLGVEPLLTIDVWEHAYYLKYQNRRVEYLEALWPIFNWSRIEDFYNLASKS